MPHRYSSQLLMQKRLLFCCTRSQQTGALAEAAVKDVGADIPGDQIVCAGVGMGIVRTEFIAHRILRVTGEYFVNRVHVDAGSA